MFIHSNVRSFVHSFIFDIVADVMFYLFQRLIFYLDNIFIPFHRLLCRALVRFNHSNLDDYPVYNMRGEISTVIKQVNPATKNFHHTFYANIPEQLEDPEDDKRYNPVAKYFILYKLCINVCNINMLDFLNQIL